MSSIDCAHEIAWGCSSVAGVSDFDGFGHEIRPRSFLNGAPLDAPAPASRSAAPAASASMRPADPAGRTHATSSARTLTARRPRSRGTREAEAWTVPPGRREGGEARRRPVPPLCRVGTHSSANFRAPGGQNRAAKPDMTAEGRWRPVSARQPFSDQGGCPRQPPCAPCPRFRPVSGPFPAAARSAPPAGQLPTDRNPTERSPDPIA